MDEELQRRLAALSPAQRELFASLAGAPRLEATAPPATYTLGPAQERFWLLEQLTPGEPAHHMAGALRLTGPVDPAALPAALAKLVARHPTLRTTVGTRDGMPMATVASPCQVPLATTDLRSLPPASRQDRLDELRARHSEAPFDLTTPPLLRVHLVQLDDQEWQLLWCVHHIAADGLSMLVLARELALAWTGDAGAQAELSAAGDGPQYHDFVAWQAARERTPLYQQHLATLAGRLQGAPVTTLAADHPPGTVAARGARLQVNVADELARAATALGRQLGCTPFVTLLATFVAALRRWTGEHDLVLGVPVANRPHAGLQQVVGLFANSAVLRFQLAPDITFVGLLQHVREVVGRTLAHGDVPFERLVRQLRPERRIDQNPLFGLMFNWVDFATLGTPPPGLQWQYEETPAGTLFEFTLYVRARGEQLRLEVEYDASRFDPITIERRLAELLTLLHAAIASPTTAVDRLPLLPPRGQHELRALEHGPPLPPGPDDVLSLLAHTTSLHGDAEAVADDHGRLSYRALAAAAAAVADALRTAGVRPGDRVGCHIGRHRCLPAAMLGAWRALAVLVPLDPSLGLQQRRDILRATGATCVLVDKQDDGADLGAIAVPLPDFESTRSPWPSARDGSELAPRPAAPSTAYVLFTSGSTGKRKGVEVPHGALAAFLRAAIATFGVDRNDTLLAITSTSFDIAMLELLLPLCVGGRVHIAPAGVARDGELLQQQLATTAATVLQATPSTFRLLLAAGWRARGAPLLLCGGEAMTPELARALCQRSPRVFNVYGPTETTVWSTAWRVDAARPVRIGRPLPGTIARVLDASGRRSAIGCPGELWLAGSGVASGYLEDAATTAARFVPWPEAGDADVAAEQPDRHYRSGDIVRWTHDGQLEFLGRIDDQVKIRGHRLEPGEVEAHLRAHPAVADAAVATWRRGEELELAAWVVPRRDATAQPSVVAQALANWRDVWQATYADPSGDPDFDCSGWRDSRTGLPIPPEVMRRFCAATAERVRALAPRSVLEVGCGTGMMTGLLAGECEQWLAVDPSAAAVDRVQALATRRRWPHVSAQQLHAGELDRLPAGAFDLVLLQSVVQYFPSLDYLLSVLDSARRRLRPGGVVFLGDVRCLPWHGAFAAWAEAATATAALPRREFAERVEHRLQAEPELLLAPMLFAALVERGAFADQWLACRSGEDDTEMQRFRVDVALTLDSRFRAPTPLQPPRSNARIATALELFSRRHDEAHSDLAAAQAAATAAAADALDPESLGKAVVPSADGRTLVALAPPLAERSPCPTAAAPLPPAAELPALANQPHHASAIADALPTELNAWLRERLPAAAVPSRWSLLPELPRLPSGKVDRKNLSLPAAVEPSPTTDALTPTERRLAPLFAEVLALPAVGVDDDFFAVGGHSLAAARLLARIRQQFPVDLPLREVFAAPTVRSLALAIDRAEPTATEPLVARPRPELLRPSGTMARLWFLQRLSPGSRAYLMIGVLDVRGPFDLACMRGAIVDVVQRHELLQLRLQERAGQALLVPATGAVPLTVCADGDAFAEQLARTNGDALQPLHVYAVRLGDRHWRLAFVLHHAYADGWSLAVLQRDLAAAYTARRRGRPMPLPPLTVQYLDWAAWLAAELTPAKRELSLAHWREQLQDAPPTLALPIRGVRPDGPVETGARLDVTLSTELVGRARTLGHQHGASLFQVVLATFQLWLARLSGQDDLVVGTTTANRDDPRLEETIGCFLNSLPVRARLGDRPGFQLHLARTRDAVEQALLHKLLPFQVLVDALAPPRDLGRTPLFQATLDWLNYPQPELALDDLELTAVDQDPGTAKFELALLVLREEPFTARIEYRTDLFAATTIQCWWRAFTHLLAAAVAEPRTPVDQLPWLDPREQGAQLAAGSGPVRTWADGDVAAMFAAAAAHAGERPAITTPTATWSYAELWQRVETLRAALQANGIGSGDVIAVHLPRSPELLVAVLASAACGAAFVPLDVDLPTARLQAMLTIAAPRLGFTTDPAALPEQLKAWPWRAPAMAAAAPMGQPPPARDLDRLAYLLFTSGSTGVPKAVAVSHRALRNYVLWARDTYGGSGGAPLHTPLGFDLSITSVFPVLASGGCVHLPAPGTGIEPLAAALAHGPFDLVKLTPSHLRALQAACDPHTIAAAARGLVIGGEALDHDAIAGLRTAGGQRHWNEYGPTEATVGCAVFEVTAAGSGPVPIGKAIANMRLYVLDALRRPVPQGVLGELWIGGAGLADGYYGRDDLTAAAFVADPFAPGERMYRSGDRASFDATGELLYHGRGDQQVKIRGHRIELEEVRQLLRQEGNVTDAAVLVRKSPAGADHLIAYLQGSFDEGALLARLRARLPAAAVPTRCLPVPVLPFDRHGKLDRCQLPDPWLASTTDERLLATPPPAALSPLLQLARELLHAPDLNDSDDFFRAGGDSILALQLVAGAAQLDLQIEVTDVFRWPRLGDLAHAARRKTSDVALPPEPAEGPLLPMQAWFFAQQFAVPDHYDQALWLRVRADIPAAAVERALTTLVARHPALRTGCRGEPQRQQLAAAAGALVFTVHPVAVAPGDEQGLRTIAANRPPFDIEAGRVLAATWVCGVPAGPSLLLLRAHHLAVDAVSWHILADELRCLLRGADLGPATASPAAFAAWLATTPDEPLGPPAAPPRWPPGDEGHADRAELALSPAETAAMQAAADGPHRVRTEELLVAALGSMLARLTGLDAITIDIEGHGRSIPGAPPLHRSIGWFTTMFRIEVPGPSASPTTRIAAVKERLRRAQARGCGPRVLAASGDVLCNFLGSVDVGPADVLGLTELDPGPARSPRNHRSHAIELQAFVRGGCMRLELRAPGHGFVCRAEQLTVALGDDLRGLLAACAALPPVLGPVDFPLAQLPASALAALLADGHATDDVYPLTPTQQGMFFLAQRHPDSLAYREQLVAELAGDLDTAALAMAFADVAARHELLRGELHWRGLPAPHWRILRRPRQQLEVVDVAPDGDPGATASAQAVRACASAALAQPFAFGNEPLLRLQIVRLGVQRHALIVTWHHVVLDGWSMPLLFAELLHHYRSHVGVRMPALPPAARFADHVALLQRQDPTAQRRFWQQRLQGVDAPTEVPSELAAEPAGSKATAAIFDEVELWCEAPATERWLADVRARGLTPSTLVAAAWALVLGRASGRSDVLFGLTVSGRDGSLRDAEHRIGLFINTLPIRVLLPADAAVAPWLHALHAELGAALAHQLTPLSVSQAQTDIPAGIDPLTSLVVYENYPLLGALGQMPAGLTLTNSFAFERTSYPLTLVAIPGERFCLRLLYDRGRWSADFALVLLRAVMHVLPTLAATKSMALGQIDWLAASPDQVAVAHGPAVAGIPELVLDRFAAMAAAEPQRVAVEQGGVASSYGELERLAQHLATVLREHGVTAASLVAICVEPGAAGVAALLAIQACGAAWLAVDANWPDERVAAVVTAAGVSIVVVDAATRTRPWPNLAVVDLAAVDLAAVAGATAATDPRLQARPALRPDDLAYAIATSGTTGQPKLVLVEQRNLAHYVQAAAHRFALTPQDRVLQFASWSFDTSSEEIWPTLATGATLVVCPQQARTSSTALWRFVAAARITVLDLPTAFFHVLAASLRDRREPLPPSLRLCILGGQACSAGAASTFLQHAPQVRLLNTYGPSEATIVATWCELTLAELHGEQPPPIGRPIPGSTAYVLGADRAPVAIGMPGELCLAGPGVARGYWQDPAATASAWIHHPQTGERLLRTGDRVRLRRDGQLEFLGRQDRQVKIAGTRIEPAEIEQALLRHPDVTDAAVHAVSRAAAADPELIAHVEAPAHVEADAVREFLRRHLPASCVPTRVVVYPALPRTGSGKVDHRALVASPRATVPRAPGTARETELLAIFRELFPDADIGIDDDFFALGGSSLVAMRLLDLVQQRCGIDLPLRILFAAPTPAGIAAAIDRGVDAALPTDDWQRETRLPDDFPTPVRRAFCAPRQVLLTGATGFFGGWILATLLRTTSTTVHCLVRAADADDATLRVQATLARLMSPAEASAFAHRIRGVAGDVADGGFGRTAAAFADLANTVDTVIHAAAAVDFLRPYAMLRRTNRDGTLEVLRLCATNGATLHHVSSVGIFDDARVTPDTTIHEDDDGRRFDHPRSGYAQSKWVAEQLVRAAAAAGVRAVVHRPGRLIAPHLPRHSEAVDFVGAMAHLCRDLGVVPAVRGRVDVTPVAWAAAALVELMQPALEGTFHLVHPKTPDAEGLLAAWQTAGVAQVRPWSEFHAAATGFLRRHPDHVAARLLPFLPADPPAAAGEPQFRCDRTLAALGSGGPGCPEIDGGFVAAWLTGPEP